MKKYSKKIRKTIEDPKSEVCGKYSKKKKIDKPYKLMYKSAPFPWERFPKEWKVWKEFKNKSDRDHELDKCRRTYKFWEWDTKDEIQQEINTKMENSDEKECKS